MSFERLVQNGYMAIKKCRHGMMMFNINDSFIGRALDLYGEWCESELVLLRQIIRPEFVILDVGANIGTHTVFFAKNLSAGKVYAFEPQRLCFQILCANVALNNLTNVFAFQKGISDIETVVKIPVLQPGSELNSGSMSIEGNLSGEDTPITTIDNLALDHCDLIKVDVEGLELKVLNGARQTIDAFHPILFVENNNIDNASQIWNLMSALGYKCWWHLANYYSADNYFKNSENVFAQYRFEANILCFHESIGVTIDGFVEVEGPDDNCLKAAERIRQNNRNKA
jgi:FkbM family methyltransferase